VLKCTHCCRWAGGNSLIQQACGQQICSTTAVKDYLAAVMDTTQLSRRRVLASLLLGVEVDKTLQVGRWQQLALAYGWHVDSLLLPLATHFGGTVQAAAGR
jgi:hypothetical protein